MQSIEVIFLNNFKKIMFKEKLIKGSNRYRCVVDLIFYKKSLKLLNSFESMSHYKTLNLKEYLDVRRDIETRNTLTWFTSKQLNLLIVSFDLVILMSLNATISIVNFIILKEDSIFYLSTVLLVVAILAQIFVSSIAALSNRREKAITKTIEKDNTLKLENIKNIPMKVILKQEDTDNEILVGLGYYALLDQYLTNTELEMYNILKKEYTGLLDELLCAVKKL
jgi:ABC-type multidrug transport system fused ATPase/permease subunit